MKTNEGFEAIYNIPQRSKLRMLGVTFQINCCLRREGLSQKESELIFHTLIT